MVAVQTDNAAAPEQLLNGMCVIVKQTVSLYSARAENMALNALIYVEKVGVLAAWIPLSVTMMKLKYKEVEQRII